MKKLVLILLFIGGGDAWTQSLKTKNVILIGEVSGECQYYQNQIAKTMAAFFGLYYTSDKSIGETILPM